MGELDLSRVRAHGLRLRPDDDLRAALEAKARELSLRAGCIVSCVGSLRHARLRLAGGDRVLELPGPLEIVSLVGTLSPDGPHLHIALADRAGSVHGGHLLSGSPVHTTAEIVIGELDGVVFARELDPATGWKELVLGPRT